MVAFPTYMTDIVLVVKNVDEGEDEDRGHVQGEREEEHEEITIVSATCNRKTD